ncbi:MAG: hypothetical protein MZU84_09300 [Sphingobacterium sp.]|nr:hypothetical protein [Sphingobacterium sp.]
MPSALAFLPTRTVKHSASPDAEGLPCPRRPERRRTRRTGYPRPGRPRGPGRA